jgi:hypothetical protein
MIVVGIELIWRRHKQDPEDAYRRGYSTYRQAEAASLSPTQILFVQVHQFGAILPDPRGSNCNSTLI